MTIDARNLEELADLYLKASPQSREAIRDGWPFDRSWRWHHRPSSLAEVLNYEPALLVYLRRRLAYNAIEEARQDYRDNLVELSEIYNIAKRGGLDADRLFIDSAEMCGPAMAELLSGWVTRDPVDQRPEAFGWTWVDGLNGPEIRSYEPTEEEKRAAQRRLRQTHPELFR